MAVVLVPGTLEEMESERALAGKSVSLGRESFRLRRLYGCLTPGTQSTPARTHPLQGFPLSQRTFRCLQRRQEYSCCWTEARNCGVEVAVEDAEAEV